MSMGSKKEVIEKNFQEVVQRSLCASVPLCL